MFGLIGKMRTTPGKRDELASILTEGTRAMPGCRSYIIALDPVEPDVLWITEVWDDEAAHRASLELPAVRDAISVGRPMIAGFEMHQTTRPVSGA